MVEEAKLSLTVDALDQVPEAARSLYEERDDGSYALAVEGLPDVGALNKALDTERTTAKKLKSELKAWSSLGANPDEVKELLDLREQIEKEKERLGKSKDEQYAQLQKSFESKLQPLHQQIAKLEHERDQAARNLDRFRVQQALRSAATTARVRPEFFDDIELRANQFGIFDGQVLAVDADGEPRRSAKDATKHMTPEEWLDEIAKAKPGWFEDSHGGGAGGGRAGRRGVVSRDDSAAFLANLDEIAKGRVRVQ